MLRILLPLALLLFPSLSVAQSLAWSPEKPLTNRTLVPDGGSRIDVASDGEGWYVIWTVENELAGTHVRADGSLGSPVATQFASMTWSKPAVVWHRDRYLVAWYDDRLRGQWVSRTGEKIGEPLVIESGFISDVVAVSNGSEVLLTGIFPGTISILQRDGTTTVLHPASLGLRIAAVASDGESFLLVGHNGGSSALAIARLSSSGEVLDSRVFPPILFGDIEAAWTGSEYVVLGTSTQGRLLALVVSREGVLQSEKELRGSPTGSALLLEPMGDGSLIAGWRSSPRSVGLVDLGAPGERSPVDLAISTTHVALSAASDELLVVWNEGGTLRHQRLDRDFRLVGQSAFTSWTVPVQTRPAVVATDSGYFAAWETRERVVAGRVEAGGARGVWPVAQSNATQTAPALASSGDVVLLAWTERLGQSGIFFRRYSANGLPLDPDPTRIEVAAVGSSGGVAPNESFIAATWTGSVFVIAWPQQHEIRWVRVTRHGVVLDAEPMRVEAAMRQGSDYPGPVPRYSPKLASGGDTILLVWQASHSSGCSIIPCGPPLPPPRIEAVRLNREGHRIDDHPLIVTGYRTEGQYAPEVASDGSSFLVTYTEADERLIRGTFVSREGGISDSIALTTGGLHQLPEELVYRQGEYLLFWRDFASWRETELTVTAVGKDGGVRWSERLAKAAPLAAWRYPNGAAAVGEDRSILVIYSRVDEAVGLAPHLWFRGVGLAEEQGRRRPLTR
jgi:hypothetical protein